jgi:NTE family protein
MEKGFYEGDRQQNYCPKCETDYGTLKKGEKEPTCDKCKIKLRTKFVGLALSGGGFRAALFHLGSLWRLNELGWLKRLAEVTSVSGGSITAAYLGLHWSNLKFEANGIATNYVDEIIPPLRDFCSRTIDIGSLVAGFIDPFRRPIELIASHYRRGLFGEKTLQDLPSDNEGPRFTIYATNLQTGVSVRLSRPYLADYRLGKIDTPHIQLATAVAASCAFPPIMCPLIIKWKPCDWTDWEDDEDGKDEVPFDKDKLRSTMLLTDGGVYDNLGLERVWDRYATVLVSDAGAPFSIMEGSLGLRLSQLFRAKRTIDIVTEQTRALRKRWLIEDLKSGIARGTYWGIATQIGDYKLVENNYPPPLINDSDTTRSLRRIRTRLNRFSAEEQERLINWGYALADAAMRRHVLQKGAMPGRLPYPGRPL